MEEEGPERLFDSIEDDVEEEEEEEAAYRLDFCPTRVEDVVAESVSEVEWDMNSGYAEWSSFDCEECESRDANKGQVSGLEHICFFIRLLLLFPAYRGCSDAGMQLHQGKHTIRFFFGS